MNRQFNQCIAMSTLTAMVMMLFSAGGCSERLARENVFANTETMLGITVAENPTTQLYEARIGWCRHELFYVPTSKLVCYTVDSKGNFVEVRQNCECLTNDPSKTPQVLGEVIVDGGGEKGGPKFALRQKLAVGSDAVKSRSALALMADTEGKARAATGLAVYGTTTSQRVQAWLHGDLDSNPPKLNQWLKDHNRGNWTSTKWLAEAPDSEIEQAARDLGIN